MNLPSPNRLEVTSEGCETSNDMHTSQHNTSSHSGDGSLLQSRASEARDAHNVEVGGSTPSSATISVDAPKASGCQTPRGTKGKDLLVLRDKLAALCGETPSHVFIADPAAQADFVKWLTAYAARAQHILHPTEKPNEAQARDIIREYARFGNSQQVVDFAHKNKLILPKGQHWWMMNPDNRPAHINGFDGKGVDHTRGIPRITNGIDVYIERPDGTLFKGHRDWLVWERRPKATAQQKGSDGSTSHSQPTLSPKELSVATKLVEIGDLSLFAERYEAALHKPLAVKLSGDKAKDVANVGQAVSEYLDALTSL